MAIESKNIKIGENTWTFATYSATKGIRISKSLMKALGPSVSALFGKEEDDTLVKAIVLLVENLDKVEVEDLIKDMLLDIRKDGREIHFDTEFAANYGTLIYLLVEVAKANFSSFFTERGITGLIKTMVNSQAQ